MTASRRTLIVLAALIALTLGLPGSDVVSTASAQILVEKAVPEMADQGTVNLDVRITGSGFLRKAEAKFYVHDTTNPGGIKVNSTRYINTTTLVANIDVAPDAVSELKFDIEVALADGRTGKGTELFTVLKKVDPCTLPDPVPVPSAYISEVPGYPGYLDGTFGNGTGRVIGPRHMAPRSARAVAVDGQGRIVVVGSSEDACAPNPTTVWAVARYLPDGDLDPTFGPNGDGVVTMGFSVNSAAEGVTIQPDGKILVGGGSPASKKGNAAYRPTIARFNMDGSLDAAFGTGGIVVVPGTTWGVFRAIVVQGDGKIVAAGASDPYALVARLLPGGTWDGTFGTDGRRLLNTEDPDGFASGSDVTIQTIGSDEYVLVGGSLSDTWVNRHHRFALWRLTSSGAPDPGFGTSGVVFTGFEFLDDSDGLVKPSHADFLAAIAVDSNNDIVAAGYMDRNGVGYGQAVLARYDASGALDSGFGVGGKVFLPRQPEGWEFANAVAIQPDGRVAVGGSGGTTPGSIVWRVDAFGNPDLSFGVSGRVDQPIANGAGGGGSRAIALQPDGKIVLAGQIFVTGNPTLRYVFVQRVWQ